MVFGNVYYVFLNKTFSVIRLDRNRIPPLGIPETDLYFDCAEKYKLISDRDRSLVCWRAIRDVSVGLIRRETTVFRRVCVAVHYGTC
jgi:hypothetical protein